jgi:hypothetical protein
MDVGERELHRLDLQVLARHRVGRERREIERVEDAERHQRGNALPIRRYLVHGDVAIGKRERRHPIVGMPLEILTPVRAPEGGRMTNDRVGERTAIERLPAGVRNLRERFGHRA